MDEPLILVMRTSSGLNYSLTNGSMYKLLNETSVMDIYYEFERYVRVIIPTIFSLIVAVGLIGNVLVTVVVIINKQMRSTMNLLILNLALADLCFIVFCVPFTATGYASSTWPFGEVWCKIVKFLVYVSVYASVYTLVLMSLYRYLAVVHPIASISVRNRANTVRILVILWVVILAGNIPLLFDYNVVNYDYYGEDRSTCISQLSANGNGFMLKLFYTSFFTFGYLLPLLSICVLYGLLLKRLLCDKVPSKHQAAKNRSKKRVTKMVIIVVVTFALCWLPNHALFMVQNFGSYSNNYSSIAFQMAANCLAYMNSCVNPILYAILSENFRKGFRKVCVSFNRKHTQSLFIDTQK